ncbi:hypothetical protein NDU88_004413 [Pleurodeles waltl]|uniref:Uncharacterized protein n=1 Tax=Pleurodeles waltl TaxID=8319 RepID=A0AAV7T9H6_PLEWA|nr:hypothetical protein NDU88_004413 [Pleurodeles waltl]
MGRNKHPGTTLGNTMERYTLATSTTDLTRRQVYRAEDETSPDPTKEFLRRLNLARIAPEEALNLDELHSGIIFRAKAPGGDGFLSEFHQAYSDVLGERLLEVLSEVRTLGILPHTMREGILCLLLEPGEETLKILHPMEPRALLLHI